MKDWDIHDFKIYLEKKVRFHFRAVILVIKGLMKLIEISSQKILFINLFFSVIRYPLNMA